MSFHLHGPLDPESPLFVGREVELARIERWLQRGNAVGAVLVPPGRWRLGEAQVIPVILRAADWEGLPFGGLEPLPRGGKPISSWPHRDDAWLDVAQGIRRVVERIGGRERVGTEGGLAPSRPG